MHVGHVVTQHRQGCQRVLDLLVRYQPREHYGTRGLTAHVHRVTGDAGIGLVDAVAHHRYPAGFHAKGHQIRRGRLRDRQILIAPVHPGRQTRFQPPAQPADERSCHRPLFSMAVVHQHHYRRGRNRAREEGNAVLCVDNDVRAHITQRTQTQTTGQQRQQRPWVHRETAAGPRDMDPVHHLAAGCARVGGTSQGHLDPGCGQLRANALQVCLTAATLRMGSVSPTQHEDLPWEVLLI
ncbi:Uncharacterised protein [Mycobacteroides abscessus subsp. abscessus]|nr:Uncharacterised protein [Mycobacteroides abscessus subsp. abscessus]